MLKVHGEGFYLCDHCNRKFCNRKSFEAHKTRVKAIKEKKEKQLFIFDTETVEVESDVV